MCFLSLMLSDDHLLWVGRAPPNAILPPPPAVYQTSHISVNPNRNYFVRQPPNPRPCIPSPRPPSPDPHSPVPPTAH